MAFKLQITDQNNGFSFNSRYENLSKAKRPSVVAKNSNGDIVETVSVFQGKSLRKGSTQRKWLDENDKEYAKDELTFTVGDEEVDEVGQTKVLDIEGYQDIKNYNDTYVMSASYEIFPDDDGMKKDIDKNRAVQKNLSGMYKLWQYLKDNNKVARGEFCPSSRGFVYSDGYIRAIEIDGKWGLEIGVFKEEKVFDHLNDGKPSKVAEEAPERTKKKIKRI